MLFSAFSAFSPYPSTPFPSTPSLLPLPLPSPSHSPATATQEEKLKFAFQIYDINNDGFISNGELFAVLKMMVGNNLTEAQLQQLVDRTIIKADLDLDAKISFKEFSNMVQSLDIGAKFTVKH